MMTDPIGDMLTRIRNAGAVQHAETQCPASNLKLAVASVLAKEGFIAGVERNEVEGKPSLLLSLRYDDDGNTLIDGIRRVSKPGRRVPSSCREVGAAREQGIRSAHADGVRAGPVSGARQSCTARYTDLRSRWSVASPSHSPVRCS